LLSGALSIVVGPLFLRAPVGAPAALTLSVACSLMVGGIIDVMIGLGWPASSWVMGLFVGINLPALRSRPRPETA
jgi:uncharacterized membrane protein HdeD (DUF308 family)